MNGTLPDGARPVTNEQRVVVELDDRPKHAVAKSEPLVVLAAEHLLADPVFASAERDGLLAQAAALEHQRVCGLVELVDVVAAVDEHRRPGRVRLRLLPPVGEQPLLRRDRAVVDPEAAAHGGISEVGLGVPLTHPCERFAFERVELAAVARELDHVEAVAERVVEAAGTDGGQLGRVAHQHNFPLRSVNGVEERGEDARLRHPRLVDHEQAAVREAALALCVEEEPVQGAARDAGRVLELVGGAAARRRPQDRGVDAAVGIRERP